MQAQPLTSVVVATDANPPVIAWLIQSDMQEYCASFQSNGITSWNDLKALKEGDVVSLGVTKIGHKNRVMGKIQELNSGAAPAPYAQQPVQQQVYAPQQQQPVYAQQQPVYAPQQAAPYNAQQPYGAAMSVQQPASDKMGKPVIVWLQWTMLGLFSLGFIFFIVAVAAPGWSNGTVKVTQSWYTTSFDVNAGLWKMCAASDCETVDDNDLKAIDAQGPAQASRAFCILDLLTSVTVVILMSLAACCSQGQKTMLRHAIFALVIVTAVFGLAAFCAYTGVQSKLDKAWTSYSYGTTTSAELKYGYCFVLQIIGFLFYLGGSFGVYKLYY